MAHVKTLATIVACLLASPILAQTYPTKPIRIVTSAAGGSLDLTARTLTPKLSEALGQPVLIDNRGLIGHELVAKAPPDGYTIILASGPLWLSQFVRDNVGWDVARDFAPITLLVTSPNVVAVHPSLPVKHTSCAHSTAPT